MEHTFVGKVSTYLSGTLRSHFFKIQLLLLDIIYMTV